MIRYALACEAGHEFDSWFADAAAYDALSRAGHVACPQCGSATIRKRPMAPALARGRDPAAPAGREIAVAPAPAPESPSPPQAVLTEPDRRVREMIRALRRHVEATAENVGPRFAEEARAIHEGASDERGIYGEASPEEVRALLDDGIAVHPLPLLPDDRH